MANPANEPPRIVEKDLSYLVVGCFLAVYNTLGIGYVESVYANAMVVALQKRGLRVEREVPVTVVYEGLEVGRHRIDLLVEGRITLELKATEKLSDIPKRQLRSYLKASDLELGLLLHFGPKAESHRVLRRRSNNHFHSLNSSNSPNSDV